MKALGNPQQVTLGTLTFEDLGRFPVWEPTGEIEDGDQVLLPVALDLAGRVPSTRGEVWCLCVCRFSNGTEAPACAVCQANSGEGPLGWSVWNGERDVRLILPPAPPFVLAEEGPEAFCRAFGLDISAAFPLEIAALCPFEMPPHRRSVVLAVDVG